MVKKTYCPYCGADVTNQKETEFGIFCPNGCGDFWRSEAIPKRELHLYFHDTEHNIMLKGG
jgi:hypothetical protein